MDQFQGDNQLPFDFGMEQPAIGPDSPLIDFTQSWSSANPSWYGSVPADATVPTLNSAHYPAASTTISPDLWMPCFALETTISGQTAGVVDFQDLNLGSAVSGHFRCNNFSPEQSVFPCEEILRWPPGSPKLGQEVLDPNPQASGKLTGSSGQQLGLSLEDYDGSGVDTTLRIKKNTGKPRLSCDYPGCRSTFPRRYELQRHQNSIHKHTVSLLCPLYGCKYSGKAFNRIDKFYEHFSKHQSPASFLCFIESCRQGPLTELELIDHLLAQHGHDYSSQPHLKELMVVLPSLKGYFDKMGFRHAPRSLSTFFNLSEARLKGKDICPLRTKGCQFRLSIDGPSLEDHIATHDILECLESLEDIRAVCKDYNLKRSSVKCPICEKKVITSGMGLAILASHFYNIHPDNLRGKLETLSELLSRICFAFASASRAGLKPHDIEVEFKKNGFDADFIKRIQFPYWCQDCILLGPSGWSAWK